ncbi:unnamed protein product [Malus baccata var. baccata]
MVPTRASSKEFNHNSQKLHTLLIKTVASSMEGNHNSQKLHTLLIKTCEAKPIYGANKSFINGGQPQFSKASHTLDQDSVKQNQFMLYPPKKLHLQGFNTKASPTKASHYLDQDSVKQNQFMVPNKASTSKFHLQSLNTKVSPTKL